MREIAWRGRADYDPMRDEEVTKMKRVRGDRVLEMKACEREKR